MKCIQCGKEFISKRSTAKFDTEACKKAYQRSGTISGTEPLAGQDLNVPVKNEDVTVNDTPKEKSFTPNWKRQFKSKREGMLAAMVMLGENDALDGQVFHLGDTTWLAKKRKLERIA